MCSELSRTVSATLDPLKLFSGIRTDLPVIVAVSGGSDSLALLHLASSWAKSCDADLRVVTVDHGLRPEAAAEAGFVSGVCESLFLQHYTLAWDGIKPSTGISEAAREARYTIIEEFAKDIGACVILTGHTMDDQVETLWMRNSRSGGNPQHLGLAGMAPEMVLPAGVTVLRPLLGARRQELRGHLSTIGQSWVEDPSNFDTSYERVRARTSLESSDLDIRLIAKFGELNGRLRKVRCEAVRDLFLRELEVREGLVYAIDASAITSEETGNSLLAMQVLIALAGGKDHYVSHDLAKSCLELKPTERQTAGGCVIANQKGTVIVHRENRNLPTLRLEPGEKALWDGRLLLENTTSQSFICRAMDATELKQEESERGEGFAISPRAALHSMPVLFNAIEGPIFPFIRSRSSLNGIRCSLRFPAIEHYASSHDAALRELANYVRSQAGIADLRADPNFRAP